MSRYWRMKNHWRISNTDSDFRLCTPEDDDVDSLVMTFKKIMHCLFINGSLEYSYNLASDTSK
jgi:hypothetical protein